MDHVIYRSTLEELSTTEHHEVIERDDGKCYVRSILVYKTVHNPPANAVLHVKSLENSSLLRGLQLVEVGWVSPVEEVHP